ncbi:hypothetical protein JTE90_019352 [Oedothorax gibbosus]|uniref:TM2 domain-containing protein n=1 Tax=Oedothorax gibbosus TaxID=931172 RepID=A0AAV6UKS6_9ARAC|nr:hypothetical protein JTE90_019352 [Oedothorax gibbosus]
MPRRLLKNLIIFLIGLLLMGVHHTYMNDNEKNKIFGCYLVCWLFASILDLRGWVNWSIMVNVFHVICIKMCDNKMLRQTVFYYLGI